MSIAPRSCRLLLASLLLFHPSGIVSPTSQLQKARVLLGVAGFPLTIPSNRSHLCLLHEALSWERIMFGINDAHLTISSTRNNLLYGVFKRVMITLGVVGLLQTIPSTRNLFFPSMACSTGSAGGFSFPYHPLSLVLELETHLFSLSLAHGQKP